MNQLVAVSTAAAIPTVAPAIIAEAAHRDAQLIELGHKLNAARAEYKRLGQLLTEIEAEAETSGAIARELKKENLPRDMEDAMKIGKTERWIKTFQKALGAEWQHLSDQQDDVISDELLESFWHQDAHSIDGYLMKAQAVAFVCSHYWDGPFDDLDWDKKNTRMLVESIFKGAGAGTVETYLQQQLQFRLPAIHRELARYQDDAIVLSNEYERLLRLSFEARVRWAAADRDDVAYEQADEEMSQIAEMMYPIEERIRGLRDASMASFRASTLVALYDARPDFHDRSELSDGNWGDMALLWAALRFTGLAGFAEEFEERLEMAIAGRQRAEDQEAEA
jgi:hypothetical protein